jgi:hypothetical protein
MLRRDYPPTRLKVNPEPEIAQRFMWSPRLTFALGIAIVLLTIFSYLIFQYINFIRPPKLAVERPHEGETVMSERIFVTGIVSPDATLKVNNQPLLVSEKGDFQGEVEVYEGTEELIFEAKSRSGKETVIKRKISVKFKE